MTRGGLALLFLDVFTDELAYDLAYFDVVLVALVLELTIERGLYHHHDFFGELFFP
jgi:hypothetical protein